MKITWKNFAISAEYRGDKPAPWTVDGKRKQNWNYHRVTIRNVDNGLYTGFDFWASIARPHLETEYDLLNAFYCFVSDAVSGLESFEGFCSEFGYDTDSRTAERTWKACKRSTAKLERITGGADLYDLCNELSEVGA